MTAGFRLRQRIQTTRGDIFLNLAVPPSSVKLGEPRPKCCESGRGKPANGILDLSNRAHVGKLTPLDRPAQPHALKEKLKPKSKRPRFPGSGWRCERGAHIAISASSNEDSDAGA
jgi:hypothetical protein